MCSIMCAHHETERKRSWLTLIHAQGLGSRSLNRLLDQFQAEELLSASDRSWQALGLNNQVINALKNPPEARIEADLAWLSAPNHLLITRDDERFPPLLAETDDAPVALFVIGEPGVLLKPQIAIVGSRNPSRLGLEHAHEFAKTLAGQGFAVTSGLALGIDAAGHRGALAAGGKTIAVTGTGLDKVYPRSHYELALEISRQGALVSEFPLGTPPRAGHFPRRNRIISGLSLGILVIEAAIKSGSLITARLALEQNREIFALPGAINNPLAAGCNMLIREGAHLVTEAEQIFSELGHYFQKQPVRQPENKQFELDPKLQTLLNQIMFSPTSIDDLVMQSGLPVNELNACLLQLELEGYIDSASGGCYIRRQ